MKADRLLEIAREIGRLSPDWGNPQRYFENRSEIEHKLKALAADLKGTTYGR
jgi:hypothetical protein